MTEVIPVGLVFSITGPYSAISRAMVDGAMLAIDEVNDNSSYQFSLEPHFIDPAAKLDSYRVACERLLKHDKIRHVIGCYTSLSRKEVIPCFEKYDGLLWYPSHYEGFETSANVIYSGAAPNQHIIPLARFMIKSYGKRAYCVGSNYIWAWENNRILREVMTANGGDVVSEKYVTVGGVDVEHLISDIVKEKPDFIFSSLIGDSRYAFIRAFMEYGKKDPAFRADKLPISDCSLSEPELEHVGPIVDHGMIASSVYFQSIKSEINQNFISKYQNRFGENSVTSADAEASYVSIILLAEAVHQAGTTAIDAVRSAAMGSGIDAPQGRVSIDADNAHCYLTPRLAWAQKDHQFDIFEEAPEPVKPDPYLTWVDLKLDKQARDLSNVEAMEIERRSHLRVVK